MSSFFDSGMSGLTTLAAFLFVLSVVVFFHELGHFLVARWCGVAVKAFSIGFGKEIWGFNDRYGTRWRVAWLPLGGYVKFMDDESAASTPSAEVIRNMSEEERSGSFHLKPLWQRAAVVAAGPIANFILAIVIFAVLFSVYGLTTLEPRVGKVVPDSPAAQAGVQPDDLILTIGGETIESFGDLQRIVSTNPEQDLKFEVDRNGQLLSLTIRPKLTEHENAITGKAKTPIIGITSKPGAERKHREVNVVEAVGLGADRTGVIITSTLSFIVDLVRGRQSADQLGGPIRIADVSGQVAKFGFQPLLNFIAVISVSIGLLNLFPIPILDGGHLMFYAIEAVRRKPLSEKAQEIGFRIGFAIVLMLMVFATFNDLPILKKWAS
ncbi:MAG: RIP metalloprotease RseP [Hyphomicrobiaceae bacterium]|nr:RIP metalloprotease RseP [Hyphomicrobiaceae bacterium]MCC0009989.1 RIP metalloprotease RseP [Hyphomicrobiaceae bacterium]